eukprot:1020802-Rhodomonas_salina.1
MMIVALALVMRKHTSGCRSPYPRVTTLTVLLVVVQTATYPGRNSYRPPAHIPRYPGNRVPGYPVPGYLYGDVCLYDNGSGLSGVPLKRADKTRENNLKISPLLWLGSPNSGTKVSGGAHLILKMFQVPTRSPKAQISVVIFSANIQGKIAAYEGIPTSNSETRVMPMQMHSKLKVIPRRREVLPSRYTKFLLLVLVCDFIGQVLLVLRVLGPAPEGGVLKSTADNQ